MKFQKENEKRKRGFGPHFVLNWLSEMKEGLGAPAFRAEAKLRFQALRPKQEICQEAAAKDIFAVGRIESSRNRKIIRYKVKSGKISLEL